MDTMLQAFCENICILRIFIFYNGTLLYTHFLVRCVCVSNIILILLFFLYIFGIIQHEHL
jgi:hypothetical protein